jgi:nicotinic acid mononucleotide adenylyltransferase
MPIYETLLRLFNGDITTIYSGTFNPFHKAHKYIADYKVGNSFDVSDTTTILEIPYFSVGKNEQEKISPTVNGYNVIRTSAMYFIDKIKIIKAMLSITTNKLYLKMGSDTLNRISNEDLQTLTNEYVDNIIVFMREGLKMSAIAKQIDNCKNYSIFVMPDELKTISSTKIRESEPLPEFNQYMDPFNEMSRRAGRANPIYISPFETFEKMGGKVNPNDYIMLCNTTKKDI